MYAYRAWFRPVVVMPGDRSPVFGAGSRGRRARVHHDDVMVR